MMRANVLSVKSFFFVMMTSAALMLVLSACSDKNRVPAGVLDPEDMEKVMWDMILADRYATMHFHMDSVKKKDVKTETFKLYEQVFQIHGIDREEFVKSYKFYLSRPDIGKVMFDSIATRAERKRNDELNELARVQRVKDSIANLTLKDSATLRLKKDSITNQLKKDSIANKLKKDSIAFKKRSDSIFNKRKLLIESRRNANLNK